LEKKWVGKIFVFLRKFLKGVENIVSKFGKKKKGWENICHLRKFLKGVENIMSLVWGG
jgi:hypothetical protein